MFRPFYLVIIRRIQVLNKCSIELQNALPLIWAHIYNDFCLITQQDAFHKDEFCSHPSSVNPTEHEDQIVFLRRRPQKRFTGM
jgi:hypothetical protein